MVSLRLQWFELNISSTTSNIAHIPAKLSLFFFLPHSPRPHPLSPLCQSHLYVRLLLLEFSFSISRHSSFPFLPTLLLPFFPPSFSLSLHLIPLSFSHIASLLSPSLSPHFLSDAYFPSSFCSSSLSLSFPFPFILPLSSLHSLSPLPSPNPLSSSLSPLSSTLSPCLSSFLSPPLSPLYSSLSPPLPPLSSLSPPSLLFPIPSLSLLSLFPIPSLSPLPIPSPLSSPHSLLPSFPSLSPHTSAPPLSPLLPSPLSFSV